MTSGNDLPQGATAHGLFFYIAQGNRARTTVIVGLSVISSLLMLGQPLLVQQLLQKITEPPSTTAPIAVGLVAVVTLAAVATAVNRYLIAAQGEGIAAKLRLDLLGVTLWLPIAKLAQQRVGDLMSRVASDTTLIKTAVSSGLFNIFGQAGLLVGATVGMALVDPLLLCVVLAAMSAVVVASALVSRRIRELSHHSQEKLGMLSTRLKSVLGALRSIRAGNATQREFDHLSRNVEDAKSAGLAHARRASVVQPLMNVFAQVAIVLVVTVGAIRISVDALSADELVTFALFLVLTITPLSDLATVIVAVQSASGALQRIMEVLNWTTEERDTAPSRPPETGPASIALNQVSFRYPGAAVTALSDVSMRIPAGTTTAVVGPSGAGKSTIFNLLLRFHDPGSGSIEVGGATIDEQSRSDVRALISYVPQDGGIVDGTLRENLSVGNPDLSDNVALAVLTQLGLDGINGFSEHGLDLDVGEQGAQLSGGEKQRMALARALLRDAPIILLDEPTSSLDGENERRFGQILDGLAGTRTIVVIAHRPQTVEHADYIYVLDRGTVTASGTHEQLMDGSELYYRLMSSKQRARRDRADPGPDQPVVGIA